MNKYKCLKSINLFSTLTEQEIEYLTRASTPHSVPKGTMVFMQGDPSRSVFFLKSGMIKISRINLDGRSLTLDLIEPGEFFGELALAGEKERRASAEAIDDSDYCEIMVKDLELYLKDRPDIAVKLIQVMGDKKLAMENLLENMIFMDVPARVVSLLLKYSVGDTVKIPLTHQEIADLTGSTRVSVSRAIIKLRRNGLIDTSGGRIRLVNLERLKEFLPDQPF
jgi:CRP/FNR family transcriptional regulator